MKTRQFIRLAAILILGSIIVPPTVFSEEKPFVHRANRDTVNWTSSEKGVWWMSPEDTDIEWPGERLGQGRLHCGVRPGRRPGGSH